MTDHAIADNPYAPPSPAEIPLEAPRDDGKRDRRGALKLLAGSVGIFVVTVGVMVLFRSAAPGPIGFGAASVVALVGLVRGFVSLVRSARSPGPAERGFTATV